jgi:hypothetical protein
MSDEDRATLRAAAADVKPTGPHLARSGFGWKIHLADGTPVGQPRKDRAKAEAALAEFIKTGKAT